MPLHVTIDRRMPRPGPGPSTSARSARRRMHLSPGATATLIGVLAMTAFAAASGVPDLSVVRVAREPVFVDLDFEGLTGLLDAESGRRGEVASRLADEAANAAANAPGRMIVLRPADLPLNFDRLPEAQAERLTRSATSRLDAADLYESAVSEMLLDLVREIRDRGVPLISVADLPLESARGGTAAVSEINGRYGVLLDELDALVSSRSFILSRSAIETNAVQDAMPRAGEHANGRPIFYRANGSWHVLMPGEQSADMDRWLGELLGLDPDGALLSEDRNAALAAARASSNGWGDPASDGTEEGPGNDRASDSAPSNPEAGGGGSGSAAGSSGGHGGGGGGGGSNRGRRGSSGGEEDGQGPSGRKRLLHFQTVGFSNPSSPGLVSPNLCTPTAGWNAHLDTPLRSLVERLGPGTFDWWGHRIGGVWGDPMQYTNEGASQTFFEQIEQARINFPKLVNYAPLVSFAAANDMDLYAYIGFPRCDSVPPFVFTPVPEHGDPQSMPRWYIELLQSGFKGIGHDWSQHLPQYSNALTVNFPYLESHGVEVFIEAMPRRSDPYFLGYSVVTSEPRFTTTQSKPEEFFTEEEIRSAGGRVIIIMAHPPEGFSGDKWQWRFNRALARLNEGRTVAVNLDTLAARGFPIEQLVEAARNDVSH